MGQSVEVGKPTRRQGTADALLQFQCLDSVLGRFAQRVGHARKAGLLPETESGVANAGLSTFHHTAEGRR